MRSEEDDDDDEDKIELVKIYFHYSSYLNGPVVFVSYPLHVNSSWAESSQMFLKRCVNNSPVILSFVSYDIYHRAVNGAEKIKILQCRFQTF